MYKRGGDHKGRPMQGVVQVEDRCKENMPGSETSKARARDEGMERARRMISTAAKGQRLEARAYRMHCRRVIRCSITSRML